MNQMDLDRIEVMENLFIEIDSIYSDMDEESKKETLLFHNEHACLPYCIRWGTQAAHEILRTHGR